MQPHLIQSPLLAAIPGLSHGFLSGHTPEGKAEIQRLEVSIATAQQVHGAELLWVAAPEKRARPADAVATLTPGLGAGVYSADCTPILVAALDANDRPVAVMAVHGGWRGTALQIGAKALRAFAADVGPRADRFVASIGPCISFESFEVGEEVVAAFPGSLERGLARPLRTDESGAQKFLFNLAGENLRQIQAAAEESGIALNTELLPICTLKESARLPSYRRDREKAGRLLSYVSIGALAAGAKLG